jgi:hypothetical protein
MHFDPILDALITLQIVIDSLLLLADEYATRMIHPSGPGRVRSAEWSQRQKDRWIMDKQLHQFQ